MVFNKLLALFCEFKNIQKRLFEMREAEIMLVGAVYLLIADK
jgi:hypothetical protein